MAETVRIILLNDKTIPIVGTFQRIKQQYALVDGQTNDFLGNKRSLIVGKLLNRSLRQQIVLNVEQIKNQARMICIDEQYTIYLLFSMEPEKQMDKQALRDKNRISAKDFIKMKRGQAKEEKNSFESFDLARSFITNNEVAKLGEFLMSSKPPFVLTFLFSEDQLKQTPLINILQADSVLSLLQAVNKWSVGNSDLIVREIYMEDNQLKSNHFRGKFQAVNKSAMEAVDRYATAGRDANQLITLLGEKDCLFYHLCKNFLTLQMVISTVCSLKSKNDLLAHYYMPLLTYSSLSELIKLTQKVRGYQDVLMRDRFWSKADSSIFKEVTFENIHLINLKELNYNIWHHLAHNSPKQFHRFAQLAIAIEEEELREKYWELLGEVDSTGETVSDICLKTWTFDQINALLALAKRIDAIMLSTACLNKLFYNRKLRQIHREALITECLESEISEKGYINVITNKRNKQCHIKGRKIVLERKPLNYTFNISFDKGEVKRRRDNTGSYPLVTYLRLYKQSASLKIVQQLYLQFLNRKEIKKKLQILMKSTDEKRITLEKTSPKYQEIQGLIYYYQPLWKVITWLPHTDVLEFLVSKTYLNCYEIKLFPSNKRAQAQLLGKHFLIDYLSNNPFLGQDSINRQILEGIVHAKQTEKKAGGNELCLELARSLINSENFLQSHEYLAMGIKSYLNQQLMLLPSGQLFIISHFEPHKPLLVIISNQLAHRKNSLLSRQQVIQKYNTDKLIEACQTQFKYLQGQKQPLKKFYQGILKDHSIEFDDDEYDQEFDWLNQKEISTFNQLQNVYLQYYGKDYKSKLFFDNIHAWLKVSSTTLLKEELSRKYWSFRLRANEKHLRYKFQRLLQLGFDPYFSKYSKTDIEFTQEEPQWNLIMSRMLKEKKTFLGALITSSTKLNPFVQIFEKNFSLQNYDFKLFKKIQQWGRNYKTGVYNEVDEDNLSKIGRDHIKRSPYFVGDNWNGYNLEIIVDILNLALKHGLTQYYFISNIRYFFQQSIKQYVSRITQQQRKHKLSNQQDKTALMQKIVDLEKDGEIFIDRWLPQLTKMHFLYQQDQQALHNYLIKLINYAKNLQCHSVTNFILKYIVFERICQTKLVVDKLESSKDADEILNAYLHTLSDDALSTWISRTIYSEKTRITSIAKTFSIQGQTNILLPLINRIQSHQDLILHSQLREVKLISLNIIYWTKVLVKTILASVARDNIVKIIKAINEIISNDNRLSSQTKQQYKSSLLSTTDDVELIALALLVTNIKYFYLRQSGQQKVKKYHIKTFYVKCNQTDYKKYLKVLQENHLLANNIGVHLKVEIISLIQAQKWTRLGQLLQIKAIQNHMVPLVFKALYLTFNRQSRCCNAQVTTIINQIFAYLQTEKTQFNEDLFVAAFSLNYQRSFKVFKPKSLSIYGFRRCIPSNPESAPLFISNKVALNLDYLPSGISAVQTKRLKYWFPMIPHSDDRISVNKWLADELRVEILLSDGLKAQRYMIKTLKAVCTSEDVLVHKKEIYERVLSDKAICEYVLRCKQFKSLTNYEKSLPDLKKMVKQELFGSVLSKKKGKCMNLNVLNPMILRDFITSKELSSTEPINMSSCFLRIVETANFYLIQLFITTNKITITYDYLKTVQQFFGFSFWEHLLAICNQDFIIAFINKYKLFEIYSPEEYSLQLLNTVCRFRHNKLLEFVIKYFQGKSGSKAIFAAETIQNKPSISKNAIFYLPIELSVKNNFYQIYFLIQGSGNQCPKFQLSGRFLSYMKPQEWNHIPQFKRRVEINNTFMETLREAQEMDFRFKVLLPSIFELQVPTEPLPQQVGDEKPKPKKNNAYLAQFIHDITKKCLNLSEQSGIFEKLCFMIFKKDETKIPEAQLEKKYPAQMKLINKIRKFIDKSNVDLTLWQLFDHVPQFKSHLLVYNPSTFLENPDYIQEIMGIGDKKLDFSEYLKGIQVNFIEFQQKYAHVLQSYIKEYFFNSSVRLGSPKASLHLTREALLLIFLDVSHHQRRQQECSILKLCSASQRFEQINYQQMQTQTEPERSPQEVIYDIAMCLNTRGKKAMNFDLMTWNKMIQEIQEIQEFWKKMGKGTTLKQYSFNPQEIDQIAYNYAHIASKRKNKYRIINWKDILCEVYYQQVTYCSKKGVFIELSLILNMFLIANDLKLLEQKIQSIKGGSSIQKINVKLVKKVTSPIKLQPSTQASSAQISIEVPFSIHKHESKEVSLFIVDDSNIIPSIQHFIYLSNLQASPTINELNHFCSHVDRHPFLKNYRFRYTVQSLKNIKQQSLTSILEHGIMKKDGAVGKIIYELQKMEERLVGTKNIKVYSSSDIYGPINFSQQPDDEKIIDCLGFYELIDLPKEEQIKVTYVDKEFTSQQKNLLSLRQIRDYIKFYISVSKDENVEKLDLSSEILVSLKKHKNEQRVELDWLRFGGWTVCEVYCLAMNYCSDLSSKIDKILDVRVSFASLINYYQKYLECGNELSIKIALEKFLFQKHFNRFVESIILMITQDVGNIMKIVKGIIIKLSINKKDAKRKGKLKISQYANAISVEYGIKDQILIIVINIQMGKGLNKTQDLKEINEDYHVLVDRKQFLDSVFTSAQFLTDYFILRNQLNNECLRISTSMTNKLNSTVNFYIQYSNLYAHVGKMRNEKSIKVIESFLVRLKQYISSSMDKTIQLYLNSQELANRHQVFILNKCEAINKGLSFKVVESQKELIYDSLETDPPTGLTEIISLMNQIGNDQNIKNVFLIQIYKSYYTTMVGQGMTFVVGYKSSKKKAQVIKITKAENINLINIVELDFIMLVSKNIPTNDQLNQSKIIRIFITDSNKNLYQLNDKIKQYFLALPEENEERNLSYFAPLISSNVMLKFALEDKREVDIHDTKVFYVDLKESQKFKLVPSFDKHLSPLNSCKKNMEFKQAISELQKGFQKFTQSSMKFIIDLPQEYSEKYISTNFSHIIHLVTTDLIQFLLKFQFEPMRNQTLDCKLSIQNGFLLNKNSIIQLRKLSFIKQYNRLRIRIRDIPTGISFSQKQVSIAIDVSNMTTLPSSTEYLSIIVDNILKNQKKELPQYVIFGHADKNESTQVLLKELDIINCIPFQIQEIKEAIQLIELIFKAKVSSFQIIIHNNKTQIKFDKGIEVYLSTGSVQREFFGAQHIIRSYIGFLHKNFEPNAKGQTYFNPIEQRIVIEEITSENVKIIYKSLQQKWISEDFTNFSQKYQQKLASKYYLIQSNNIYSNYFFKVSKQLAIKEKDAQGTRCKSKHLYLQSSKAINLNFTNISIAETSPLFKQNTNSFNILRSPLEKNKIIIQLLSRNMYLITITYEQSMILNINYAGNTNVFRQQLDSTRMIISSDGQLCLDNTKFLQLQAYKKKPVLIKDKQNQIKNSQFRESNELASEKELQLKLGDFNNIENLVYVVNDECKRFSTRAGEPRVDYIQLCDNDGNPIDYKAKLQVMFVHINKLAIVRPEIIPRNMQLGLKWTPTIRGHYYLYINNVSTNPPYEIGVCAAHADYKTTVVTLPKIKKICYCQETQLMMDLRDSFGNLYTQLQEDILGDSLLIELKSSRLNEALKIEKSQINKYGLKKVKFSFNNSEQQKATDIEITVFLNCEEIAKFVLTMEGLSLKQRKKLLQKDISLSSKNYYKDITINRNRFLQDLFVVAEKSLHTNISVRFVNEPGIDAGGVKREFYDMIGNELKSERNPFFKMINPNTMEYFLNPEILRNKKKLQYMELWGKYLANSFLNSYLIGVSFSPVFVKLLYEQSIDFEDLLSVLPQEERKQYEYLFTASSEDFEDLDLYFTVIVDKKKCIQVELKQGGKDIRVTPQNVKEYLEYTAQILLTERYKEIMIAFRKGFETVLQLKIFKKWIRNSEFWCLTTGNKEITPELVLNYIVFQGSSIDNISGWFRRFISEANHEVLVGFLKFSSGSSSIDFSLSSKVTVTFENAGENPKKLPISHTCWKEIVVPKYKNYDIMKKLLTAAFIYCSEGFGFG